MKNNDPKDLLTFPCHFQFKAMGVAGDHFKNAIVAAVNKYAVVAQDAVKNRPSGKGTYQSVSVLVTLHTYEQLTSIYAEMRLVSGLKLLL